MHLILSAATILGSLDRDRYRGTLESHRDDLAACVSEQPEGALTAKLIVTSDCAVDVVRFQDATEGAPTDCLQDVLLNMTEALPRSHCGCGIVIIEQPISWQAASPHETSGESPD